MKYHVAFYFFVAVFIISTGTMFLAPLKSEVSDYKRITPNENADLTPANENATTNTDVSPTKEDASANTDVSPNKENLSKETVRRKSGKTNKNRRFPEAKAATPTPTPTPTRISGELAGLNYVNITCAIISAIGAVFSAIFGYRQDRRYKP